MGDRIAVNDPGKLLVVLVVIVGGMVLAIVSLVVHDGGGLTAGCSMITAALGYVTGNGRLASRTQAPATMLAPVLPEDQFVHIDDVEQLEAMALARRRTAAKVARARTASS
jgi:hypothetical protein